MGFLPPDIWKEVRRGNRLVSFFWFSSKLIYVVVNKVANNKIRDLSRNVHSVIRMVPPLDVVKRAAKRCATFDVVWRTVFSISFIRILCKCYNVMAKSLDSLDKNHIGIVYGIYRTYCIDHHVPQHIDIPEDEWKCPICLTLIEKEENPIMPTCCKGTVFHKQCVKVAYL